MNNIQYLKMAVIYGKEWRKPLLLKLQTLSNCLKHHALLNLKVKKSAQTRHFDTDWNGS
jgi:hypothetical protein